MCLQEQKFYMYEGIPLRLVHVLFLKSFFFFFYLLDVTKSTDSEFKQLHLLCRYLHSLHSWCHFDFSISTMMHQNVSTCSWPGHPHPSRLYFPPILFPHLLPSHMTKECECHGHSDSCHFSLRAWRSSGRTSGGVCDNCQHNTEGRRCHRCRHGYHRHTSLPLKSPHACTRKDQDATRSDQKSIK